MREKKFRAWDMETEEFIYSDQQYDEAWFCFDDGKLKAFAIHGMTGGSLDEPPTPNCEELEDPQQYTGLHDKNGKEIYEGDIVKFEDLLEFGHPVVKSIIEWNPYKCSFQPREIKVNYKGGRYWALWDCCLNIEIIGNIYEKEEPT